VNTAVKRLRLAGLLPHDNVPAGGNPEEWKQALLGAWRAAAALTNPRSRTIVDRLLDGCDLFLGRPDWMHLPADDWRSWIGQRFCWWPTDAARMKGTAIVCSRLGRRLDNHRRWLRILDDRVKELSPSDCLIASAGTSSYELSRQLSRRHTIPLLTLRGADDWKAWGRRCRSATTFVEFSPPIDRPPRSVVALPLADRLAHTVATDVWVGYVRPEGNISQLLKLRQQRRPPSTVESLVPMRHDGCNAVEHWLEWQEVGPPAPLMRVDQIDCRFPWLQHWTRACHGPWPGQSLSGFWDDLFENGARGDRSALATLVRILNKRRIIAGDRTVAGSTRAVSFANVPLAQWPVRRFRSHRGRYDFERYGVSVRRSTLLKMGAQPVIYGPSNTGVNNDFFQRIQAGDPRGWTLEREWRILGDVDLSGLSTSEALVFVASQHEAKLVSSISPWPVAYFE